MVTYIYIIVFVEKIEVCNLKFKESGDSQVQKLLQNSPFFSLQKTQGHCLVLWHPSLGRPGGGQRWPTGLGDVALGGVADVARGLGGVEGVKVFWVNTVASYDHGWYHGSFMTILIGCFSSEKKECDMWGRNRTRVTFRWQFMFWQTRCLTSLDSGQIQKDQLMKLMRWTRSCIGDIKQKKMQKTTWCRNRTWWRWRWHWRPLVQVHSWDSDTSWSGRCLVIGIKGWHILSHYTILCMKLMEGSP